MAWSDTQRKLFLIAAGAAGWNESMRYVAMRAAGCPVAKRDKGAIRPSLTDHRNSNPAFERAMELAERCARARGAGAKVPTPRNFRSWSDALSRETARTEQLIAAIAAEAIERAPGKFADGFLEGFIKRQTTNDDPSLEAVVPACLLCECSPSQLYNVLEGLKAWVGRTFVQAGLTPRSFDLPKRFEREIHHRGAEDTEGERSDSPSVASSLRRSVASSSQGASA